MRVKLYDETNGTYYFKCPAGHHHYINTKVPNQQNAQWDFNGDLNFPTFSPSVNEKAGRYVEGCNLEGDADWKAHLDNSSYICHFNIVEGKIIFHGDCTHGLANTIQLLPEIE